VDTVQLSGLLKRALSLASTEHKTERTSRGRMPVFSNGANWQKPLSVDS
jgi:hypothetical protein